MVSSALLVCQQHPVLRWGVAVSLRDVSKQGGRAVMAPLFSIQGV